jgi:predicted nucleic acid-binding Zn ribbon protein
MLAASCPRCGAPAPPQISRCRTCGFVFFEERRRVPRRGVVVAATLGLVVVAAVIAGAAALLSRDEPAAAPPPQGPVAAARAERWLEAQFADAGDDDTASARCRRVARMAGPTRCQVRYPNGDTQLMLVALDERGELAVSIPYPAQRRPAAQPD